MEEQSESCAHVYFFADKYRSFAKALELESINVIEAKADTVKMSRKLARATDSRIMMW